MKKWFIALAALALLLIPSVAMADADGPQYCSACGECMEKVSVTPYERYHVILWECKSCGKTQKTYPDHTLGAATCVGRICTVCNYRDDEMDEFNHVNPTIIGYTRVDSNEHSKVIYCDACNGSEWIYEKHTFGKWTSTEDGKKHTGSCLCGEETTADHTGGNPTCQTSATCSVCKLPYYGSHNWGEWQPGTINTSLHYRICQNAGCSASESESHDGNSNCVTPATCSKCHASYTDTTKHAGHFKYAYNKYDESFHKRIETCTACGNETGNQVSTKHEESTPADCAHAAWCNVCNRAYGEPNPNNHVWGEWTTDEMTHKRTCQTPGCDAVDEGSHTSEPRATCKTEQTCAICNVQYHDGTNHEGEAETRYQYYSESQHKLNKFCSSCGKTIFEGYEAHTETNAATCQAPAYCGDCKSSYGDVDQDNHEGEAMTTYAKTSETQHTPTTVYDGCMHSVIGSPVDHKETTAATCQAPAYCADCQSNYGSKAGHNWSAWSKSDENQHVRTCQTSGCDAVEYAAHTGGSPTCTTAATCATCNEPYYDGTNHEGERKTTYAIDPKDETRHIAMQICAGCRATLTTASGGHTTDKSATCMKGMHCKICDLYYGATVDHVMSRWLPADDGQRHYRTCEYGCGKTEYGKHNVSSPATCAFPAYCKDCGHFGDVDADAHDWSAWKLYDTDQHYRYCRKNKTAHVEYADHTGGAATCETRAMCDVCNEYYGQMLGHDYVMHDAQAATCTEIGWAAYATCSRCDYSGYAEKPALGHDYAAKTTKPTCTKKGYTTHTCTRCQDSYRDEIVSALGHWYGEWMPNADGTNSASCLRDAYEHTVDCVRFSFVLTAEDVRTEFVLCPVCGEVSEIRLIDENGEVVETREAVRLLLVEDAKAEALTECLPEGELVVRMGALESGDVLMSVAFEIGGEPTQPTGQVKITLPAGLLEGYALCLLSEDGTEAELTLEGDEEEETVSFTLDFTNSETPVQVIRLIPEV